MGPVEEYRLLYGSFVQRQEDDERVICFDPSEEGRCMHCGGESDLDSGLCETCWEGEQD